jgi:hypothetical protein
MKGLLKITQNAMESITAINKLVQPKADARLTFTANLYHPVKRQYEAHDTSRLKIARIIFQCDLLCVGLAMNSG